MSRIADYMESDHSRLDALLAEAIANEFAPAHYNEFRRGLLRHIGIEEKLLFPRLKAFEECHARLAMLRAQHGALGALLVPKGSTAIAGAIRDMLDKHNAIEEGSSGIYNQILLSDEEDARLLNEIDRYPEVPLSAAMDRLSDLGPVRRAMERAGFDPARYSI